MWLFDSRIADLRKTYHFLVNIADHRDLDIASRRSGKVLRDLNPPTHPLPSSTLANVTVEISIAKKKEVRVESLPVYTLKVRPPKPNKKHAVIRGEDTGKVVTYIKSVSEHDAYIEMDGERTYIKKADICTLEL